MTHPRLVLITRRFWPLVGGAESVMANLAEEFAARGSEVTLLTAHWEADWPRRFAYRGAAVVRLPNPPLRLWGTWRYMRAIRRWLRENRTAYDLAYVSMLKHDAYAALAEVGKHVPVVLRTEGAGVTGDCVWQLEANGGRRIKRLCLTAPAVIGPSDAVVRELHAAGYPRQRVHFVPNGVALRPPPSPSDRERARRTLAEANPSLRLPEVDTPLAVFTGRLHEGKGLEDLVAAWRTVVRRRPEARLWLVGEGPMRSPLQDTIAAGNLQSSVILAGTFENVDPLLAAADLYVLPSWEEGMSIALLEAMAAGLPIVATDIPGNRGLLEDDRHGLLVPKQAPRPLGEAILCLFDDRGRAAELGLAARDRVQREFSVAKMADAHLDLFAPLLEERS